MKIVNLLDDFSLGGVTKGLGIFDEPEIRDIATFETVAVQPDRFLAKAFNADILITHFPPSWRRLPYLVSLRRKNPNARLVHVEHSYTENWSLRNVSHRMRFQKMLSLSLAQFDDVVCVSNAQRHWIAELTGLPPENLRTIYPYTRHQGLDQLPAPHFKKGGNLTVGMYGRLHECKGFDRVISAVRGLGPDCGLNLIIGGNGPEESALKSLADDAPNIHFAGLVTNVAEFLGQCDVVVIPSRNEAFGQVALEARRAARPLLVSDIDGLPEQVFECGLIVNCRSQHILTAALSLLKILPLAYMSKKARLSAENARAQTVNGWINLFA